MRTSLAACLLLAKRILSFSPRRLLAPPSINQTRPHPWNLVFAAAADALAGFVLCGTTIALVDLTICIVRLGYDLWCCNLPAVVADHAK